MAVLGINKVLRARTVCLTRFRFASLIRYGVRPSWFKEAAHIGDVSSGTRMGETTQGIREDMPLKRAPVIF
jgi:hypothetical protein